MDSRYQLKEKYAEQAGVTTYEGVDSLTGLPVLIYQFIGRSLTTLMNLESENIPGILASQQDGEQAQVVVAYSKNYRPLSVPLTLDTAKLLIGSARALKDAAQAGIIHGDINPNRFLASGDHVLLEGFGLPWQVSDDAFRPPEAASGASFAADVYAWAKSLLALTDGSVSPEVKSLLNACLAQKPGERPAASEIYSALKTAAVAVPVEEEVFVPSEGASAAPSGLDPIELDFTPDTSSQAPAARTAAPSADESEPDDFMAFFGKANTPEIDAPVNTEPKEVPEMPPVEGFYDEYAEEMMGQADDSGPGDRFDEPSLVVSDADERDVITTPSAPPGTAKAERKFIKNLPPGATYRAGEASNVDTRPGMFEEYAFDDKPKRQPRDIRRIVLLFLFLVGVAVLAYLLTQQDFRRAGPVAPPPQELTRYPVEVQIGPASLPPVEIVVVQSPAGSRLLPNTVVGRFSPGLNNIVLDKEGVWQLQARFQDRVSEVVSFELPQQRNVALTLPEAPQEP